MRYAKPIFSAFLELPGVEATSARLARVDAAMIDQIPRRVDHLEENLGAVHVELTPVGIANRGELSKMKVHGGRMSAKYLTEVEESLL